MKPLAWPITVLAPDAAGPALQARILPSDAPDRDLFAELRRDPRLTTDMLWNISEAIMNQRIPNDTHEEKRTAAQIVWDEGREEGRAEVLRELAAALRDPRVLAEIVGSGLSETVIASLLQSGSPGKEPTR